jgi:fructokinase
MPQLISLGELLIDFVALERDVSLMDSSGFTKAPGGAPANVAAGFAKLGGSSGFIGKVGDDPFGYYLKTVLEEIPVDTTCLAMDKDARTTLSFVANYSSGIRDCVFYRNPGADMLLSPEDISEEYFKQALIFHYGSISFNSPLSKQASLKALAFAKNHQLLISYDPNLRMSLWESEELARAEINAGFQYADLVKISEEEMEFITGSHSLEACAAYILQKGPRLVLISRGKDGCYYSDGTDSGYLNGIEVNAIETTGAGDAFMAAVLYQLSQNINVGKDASLTVDEKLTSILQFANAAGALATTRIGAIPALPTNLEVNELISKIY